MSEVETAQTIWRRIHPNGSFEDYAGCPDCEHKDDILHAFERDMRVLKGKLTRLERDAEAEARAHKLWDEAEAIFEWWCLATNHEGAKFSVERFKQILPRLKERRFGPLGILKGIAGAAFDAGERPRSNGSIEYFDDIELITRADHKLENFQERVYGGADSESWKRWLLDRIESNLTPSVVDTTTPRSP